MSTLAITFYMTNLKTLASNGNIIETIDLNSQSTKITQIVEQVTLRKLVYAREFLALNGRPRYGTRGQIRDRLITFLGENPNSLENLKSLLDELDAWGDQRIRIGQLPHEVLADFQSRELFLQKVSQAGMDSHLGGLIPISPETTLTPIRILYDDDNPADRSLTLVAAKSRVVMKPHPEVPDLTDEETYPGIIFKPYKHENQKVIAFAEIHLNSGLTIISTALLRHGVTYKTEFEEFYTLFEPLIPLQSTNPIEFYQAIRNIRHTLTAAQVRIMMNKKRTSSGGTVDHRSSGARVDIRQDSELASSEMVLDALPGQYCSCFWEPLDSLSECVHTHLYAPNGEVSIMGQVREESARYVLRRILELN